MRKSIVLDAKVENLYSLLDVINEELNEMKCEEAIISTIDICVEEVFVNIATYAYDNESGQVEVDITMDQDIIDILFMDEGRPYDPLKKEDPDIALGAIDRQIGGLGVFLVKEMMDFVDYEYKEKKNCLRLRKAIKEIE